MTSPRCRGCGSASRTLLVVENTVGLKELRQNASELVRRAEAGEEFTITVSGRPSARLVPMSPMRWRSWGDVAELFSGPGDPGWEHDRELVADGLRDPWAKR